MTLSEIIVYSNPDDLTRVCTICPSGELSIEELISRHVTTPFIITTPSELPKEDCFYEAWSLIDGQIVVNIHKAKDIVRQKIRKDRIPELTKLDVLYMRAIELGDASKQLEIASQKQKLRDLPLHPKINELSIAELSQVSLQKILSY